MKRLLAALAAAGVVVVLLLAVLLSAAQSMLVSTSVEQVTATAETDLCTPALPAPAPAAPAGPAAARVAGLTAEQTENARIIVATGKQLGIPTRGMVVAVATALQESSLRNLGYGDRVGPDSRGLFQQRDPWGPLEERRDPAGATRLFFNGGRAAGTPGLTGIPGWEAMPIWQAAQRVQRSAFPRAYAKHETQATAAVAALAGAVGEGGASIPVPACIPPAALTAPVLPGLVPIEGCRPSGLRAEAGLTRDALQVMRCTAQLIPTQYGMGGNGPRPNKSDHGTGRAVDVMTGPADVMPDAAQAAYGDQVAAFYQQNADAFGVTYLIWKKRIWSVARADEGWRPYTHPTGRTGPTVDHWDHVHVSVQGSAGTVPSQ